jgi:hypothetical protein
MSEQTELSVFPCLVDYRWRLLFEPSFVQGHRVCFGFDDEYPLPNALFDKRLNSEPNWDRFTSSSISTINRNN